MRKRISSIVLTVVMILGCFITDMDVNINTVNADPYNIEISVETKEIEIEEIPKDRLIPLDVWVSNVPDEDFYFFDIVYKLDDKIGNYSKYCEYSNTFLTTRLCDSDTSVICIESDAAFFNNKKIPNGRFYTLNIYIPTDVIEGNFYEVIPIPEYSKDIYTIYTSFAFETNRDEIFQESNFTFHGGGIKIRSSQPEQPAPSDPTPTENNINSDQPNIDPVTQSPIITESNASTEETTYLTSSSSTTSVTSSSKVTTTSAKITTTNTSENITEITTTFGNNKEDNKTNIIILFIILLIFIITITLLIRKRKKKWAEIISLSIKLKMLNTIQYPKYSKY